MPNFVVDASDVLPEDPNRDQLHPTQEQREKDDERCAERQWLSETESGDHKINRREEPEPAHDEAREQREIEKEVREAHQAVEADP